MEFANNDPRDNWEFGSVQNRSPAQRRPNPARSGRSRLPHMILAFLVAAYSVYSYFQSFQTNPVTGESQRISMSIEQEIAMGRQAAAQMVSRHGGLHPDPARQNRVDRLGEEILAAAIGDDNPYPFEFHVLKNERAINAFALPGGQVLITAGLLDRLETDGQLAGVLAHEIGHVVERHAAERLAKAELSKGITGAIVIAAYDPDDPETQKAAQVALALQHLINMKYGRQDELESDRNGVLFMAKAGYDPTALIRVMEILKAAGNGRTPEFFNTHPNPDRRIALIEQAIADLYPEGVPARLEP